MSNNKIAILSGKGGTGKTFVSTNLATVVSPSIYIDCDIEEPNGHLFLKPIDIKTKEVKKEIPVYIAEKCTGCRTCVDFCKFNALAYINSKIMVFDDICHSCGGCIALCPNKALEIKHKTIGVINSGISGETEVHTGMLNIGESSGISIINDLFLKTKNREIPIFVDCPPGSACSLMQSIMDVDYCLLVAEPTIFGLHNLKMVYEVVKLFKKPCGLILNMSSENNNPIEKFCNENNIPIIAHITYDREISHLISMGKLCVKEKKEIENTFKDIYKTIQQEMQI